MLDDEGFFKNGERKKKDFPRDSRRLKATTLKCWSWRQRDLEIHLIYA